MPEDFDSILNNCLTDIDAGRATIKNCLSRYPQHAHQLAPLLRVADQAQSIPTPALRPEKRRAIESRLISRMAQIHSDQRAHARKRSARQFALKRLISISAAALVACIATGFGALAASAASLPGDLLYPVKRLSEQVTVALTPASAQTRLHLGLAQRRLDEFYTLSARGDVRQDLLVDISAETAAALSGLEYSDTANRQVAIEQIAQETEKQMQVLANVWDDAPDSAKPALQLAIATIQNKRLQILSVLEKETKSTDTSDQNNRSTSKPTRTALKKGRAIANYPTVIPRKGAPTANPASNKPNSERGTPHPHSTPPGQGKSNRPATPPGQGNTNPPHDPPSPDGGKNNNSSGGNQVDGNSKK